MGRSIRELVQNCSHSTTSENDSKKRQCQQHRSIAWYCVPCPVCPLVSLYAPSFFSLSALSPSFVMIDSTLILQYYRTESGILSHSSDVSLDDKETFLSDIPTFFLHCHHPSNSHIMRPTHATIALALCLSIVRAQDQQATFDTSSQQQQQEAQQPEQEKWQTTPGDYPFKPTAPPPPTADQFAQAKSGLQQLMAEMNVKHVEPLFNTMDGYCSAFKGLCTAACAERIKLSKTQDRQDGEIAVEDASEYAGGQEVKGCIDPQAQTVASAGAMCQCAGYDMTDRINFAV